MSNLLTTGLLVLVAATTAAGDEKPPFKVTTKRADDRVDVKAETGKVIVSVHSPIGIGHAASSGLTGNGRPPLCCACT